MAIRWVPENLGWCKASLSCPSNSKCLQSISSLSLSAIQHISVRDRSKCYRLDNPLVKESGTGGEVNDIELAGGEEDRTQLRVPLVDHQTHNTGKWGGWKEIITREK